MESLKLPRLIAHRGASKYAPENTLIALRKAYELGAQWVEFDVQLTSCGEAIIFHDNRLDRCTDGKGLVRKTSYSAISQLDAGSWFNHKFAGERVPTLVEWLKLAAELGLGINIELKGRKQQAQWLAEQVRVALLRHWPNDLPKPLISSQSIACLRAIAACQLDVNLAYVTEKEWGRWPKIVSELNCISLHVNYKKITPQWMARIFDHHIKALAYTVNNKALALDLFSQEVQAVFSDDPMLLDYHGLKSV